MEIRSITNTDIEAVIALWHKCGLTRPWNNPDKDIDIARKNGSSNILVGVQGNTILATVMCGFDGHRGWLYYVAVHPEYQGNGYGQKVTQAAENWLRQLGAVKVELMIRDDNFSVRDFYHNIGYEVEPRIVMAKWLEEPPARQTETRPALDTPPLKRVHE